MIYRTYIPGYPLNQFIDHFTYFKYKSVSHNIDRFLPDGNIEVVIDLTDYPKFIYDNDSLTQIQECNDVWISGIRTKCIYIPSRRNSEMFVIYFRKGMTYPFVQILLSEITDRVIPGEIILSRSIRILRDALLFINSIEQKFLFAERHLFKVYGKVLTPNPFIAFAVSQILKSPQRLTIEEISNKVGYSQKHLIYIFKQHVGVTPKSFLRIIRFQRAILEIEKLGTINWAQLALECGYYDQAHFIADFKNFSGLTPAEYIKQKNNTLNYVPVG